MDKSRALALFLAVARAGSFSRAASDAGITPQAMSKAVKQLEAELGVRLLHRTTRKLSLTDEGARLFELADPGLRLLDDALGQVQQSRQAEAGLVRITAPPSVATHVLVPLIAEFQAEYPQTHFDLVLEDQFTDLIESRIDVGFRSGNAPERNVVARHLGNVPMSICAAPAYLARHGTPDSLEALLRQHRCTGFRHPKTGRTMPWELMVDGELVFQNVTSVFSCDDVATEHAAVLSGVGIGQLLDFTIAADLAAGRLVRLLPELASARPGLYMYYAQRTQIPLRVRRFIDFVIAAADPKRAAAGTA
ncbi:LysR family transcriptional regulator [Uliginosibacterium sp. H3]|uniref:LysR family transcriptional regulator n=1 Tax=Uliginosibacterium silvisoli TaxID=3114758 RepID=A0ABU6K5G4_9RHOO|nr:LysR family transcriptional regulator [Uliginosibacterium sp. H3]